MSRRQYPRLGHGPKERPEPQHRCCACDSPAVSSLWIEWSYMRGEDEREFVCARHGSMAGSQFNRFMADMKANAARLAKAEKNSAMLAARKQP